MADIFKTPGVYIKEIPTFPPSVAEVETAIPAFTGYTEKAAFNGVDLHLKPTRITSLLEYEAVFGKAQKEKSITVSIADTTNGNTLTSRVINASSASAKQSRFKMYYSLQMFFANGGGPCYITSAGTYENVNSAAADTDIVKKDLSDGLAEVAKFDEPTLIIFPDATTLSNSDYNALMGEALAQCNLLQDRFVIMDVKPKPGGVNIIDDSMNDFRNAQLMESNIDKLKYGAAYFPFIETALNYRFEEADITVEYKRNNAVLPKDDTTTGLAVTAANTDVTAAQAEVTAAQADVAAATATAAIEDDAPAQAALDAANAKLAKANETLTSEKPTLVPPH